MVERLNEGGQIKTSKKTMGSENTEKQKAGKAKTNMRQFCDQNIIEER